MGRITLDGTSINEAEHRSGGFYGRRVGHGLLGADSHLPMSIYENMIFGLKLIGGDRDNVPERVGIRVASGVSVGGGQGPARHGGQ